MLQDMGVGIDDSTSHGSTQYNSIVDAYAKLYQPDGGLRNDFPLAQLDIHQMHAALTDLTIDVRGKRILDLACGNGHNTCRYLDWGAESVTGMDISSASIELARQSAESRGILESRARYVLGDATDTEIVVEGAPFDIVTSSWLLNYASDADMMTRMWKFIGRHLKPGGFCIALTVSPLLTDQPWEEQALAHAMGSSGVWGRHGNVGTVLKTMPNGDGYKTRINLDLVVQDEMPYFENYYLCMKVFEQSYKASGVFNGLEWREFFVPQEMKERYPAGYWNDLILWPHCRVCVAQRSS